MLNQAYKPFGQFSRHNAKEFLALSIIFAFSFVETIPAYIGPGAGFTVISFFFVLLITFALSLFYLLCWPIRLAIRAVLHKGSPARGKSQVKRVIIVGLDGMDPNLAIKFMKEGKLPHFLKLKEGGSFAPLATSYPSISPVAWSSFMTGVDPSHHNIFDFLTRDPCTYQPMLSSAEIARASKVLPIGKYMLPLGRPTLKLFRKSKPFWKILGDNGIFSSIIRVPITFPPEKFEGVLLSGMCVPDLRGSQGTFSYYTTNANDKRGGTGGVNYHVTLKDDKIHTYLHGPENSLTREATELRVPLTIKIERAKDRVEIEVCRQKILLEPGNYSPWVKVSFRRGLGIKLHGICRFYVNQISPGFQLYVTPINIDPEKPALPISHPFIYSIYLAKLIGPYATLGMAEDTWALNQRVLDEDAFLKQAYFLYEEREKMFFKALERTPRGLCVCVFETPDRIQHMFYRCLDQGHPANKGKEVEKYRNVIEDLYVRMDTLIGRVLETAGDETAIIVMSDHGFTQFKRGVNLNTWLFQNGYLVLKDQKTTSREWFKDVDWSRTIAFSLGLTSLFINRKARESSGIVAEGDELQKVKRKLIEKLTGLEDSETGQIAIREVVDTEKMFSGPYLYDAPDLLIGYNAGYRSSWDCAVGRVTEKVFEDNTRSWSGDHCVDPKLVPGVFFCNQKINTSQPDIKDIAPTVLKLFGLEIPSQIKGKTLIDQLEDLQPDQQGRWKEEKPTVEVS